MHLTICASHTDSLATETRSARCAEREKGKKKRQLSIFAAFFVRLSSGAGCFFFAEHNKRAEKIAHNLPSDDERRLIADRPAMLSSPLRRLSSCHVPRHFPCVLQLDDDCCCLKFTTFLRPNKTQKKIFFYSHNFHRTPKLDSHFHISRSVFCCQWNWQYRAPTTPTRRIEWNFFRSFFCRLLINSFPTPSPMCDLTFRMQSESPTEAGRPTASGKFSVGNFFW